MQTPFPENRRYRYSQTGHFADFEQVKDDGQFYVFELVKDEVLLMNLERSRMMVILLTLG